MSNVEEIEEFSIPTPEPGKVVKATITAIYKGKLKDLIDIEAIRNEVVKQRFKRNAGRDAIQIEFDVNGIKYRQVFIITTNPRSNLVKLMKKYKKLKVGMEIDVVFNERGLPRIYLE